MFIHQQATLRMEKRAGHLHGSIGRRQQRRWVKAPTMTIRDAARGKGGEDPVDDDIIRELLQTMIKQRRESIDMYQKGGRQELADREAREIDVIERFLPAQMDEDAIKAAVSAIIAETGASGLKEMGMVMSTLRERHPGEMDFGKAGAMAKAALS